MAMGVAMALPLPLGTEQRRLARRAPRPLPTKRPLLADSPVTGPRHPGDVLYPDDGRFQLKVRPRI